MAKTSQTNQNSLDAAAVCMAETDPKASCPENIKDFLCRVYCCANAHPFKGEKGNECRQACADKLLTALRTSSNGGDQKECGMAGNTRYYNSYEHDMMPMTQKEEEEYGFKDNKSEYKHKHVNGKQVSYKTRIPDVTVFNEKMQVEAVYDFKFPSDSKRESQKNDYLRLVGGEASKLVYLDDETCSCNHKKKDLSPEEKQQVIDNIHNSIPEFFN